MHEDRAIGAIQLWRMETRPFTEKQITLVKTFAGQAAIAIDNVRMFNETKEALDRQTAMSEILRVISRSPTNVQPVFDTIAAAALRLCDAVSALVFTFDGELIHLAAGANLNADSADAWRRAFPRRPSRDTAATRAVLTGKVVMIPDVLDDPEYMIGPTAAATGFRSALAVPLIRDEKPIGVIGVGKPEPGPFHENQIALLQTFADQAVIAIENARLFNETKEALDQQTAISEILRVISSSPTDVQPVLDAIAERAARLCDAAAASMYLIDGESLKHLASKGPSARPGEPRRYAADRSQLADRARRARAPHDPRRRPPCRGERISAQLRARETARPSHASSSRRCCAKDSRSARSCFAGNKCGRSASARSRCCEPSAIRRRSHSRTCGCSTRRRRRSTSNGRRAKCWRRSAARSRTPGRCSTTILQSCERLFAGQDRR